MLMAVSLERFVSGMYAMVLTPAYIPVLQCWLDYMIGDDEAWVQDRY